MLVVSLLMDYGTYVLVPYSGTVDELLYKECLSGKIELAKGFSQRKGNLYTINTPDGKELEVPELMCGMFVFNCHYDSDGKYFMPIKMYDKIKGKLIAKRKGRLEHFALPGKLNEFETCIY